LLKRNYECLHHIADSIESPVKPDNTKKANQLDSYSQRVSVAGLDDLISKKLGKTRK
jgi:hypothetical protein